jgi:hypothetical protein
MTLLYVDSFDHYDTSELQEKDWSTNAGSIVHKITQGEGRRGGACLKSNVGIGQFSLVAIHTIEPDSAMVVLGAAINIETYKGQKQVEFRDAVGASVALFETTPAGEITITAGTKTATTAAAIYTPNTYAYYELKYIKGTGADGFLELRKNTVVLLTITDHEETTDVSSFELIETFVLQDFSRLDDLYVLNGLGSKNNDYLGDVRVDAHFAASDGSVQNFNPNTGAASWTHVDDNPFPDADTTFNQAGSISDRDLHFMDASTLNTTIHGVQPVVLNRKTDAGSVHVQLISEKSGGSGEQITNLEFTSDDYEFHYNILENDPDDDVTWTDSRIDATEFGYKIFNIIT